MNIDFCAIPGGTFLMGAEAPAINGHAEMFAYAFKDWPHEEIVPWFRKHTPPRTVTLAGFDMARTLVTRSQFAAFEQAALGRASALSEGDGELPVEGVSYLAARQFCEWLSTVTGEAIALPTEAEWEFAASSRGRYLFPWGDQFDPARANTAESGIGRATRAEAFAAGMSEQGILDLAGNLEEWTDTPYLPYPGGSFVHDHISEENGTSYPVLRGGCYRHHGDLCLAFRRHGFRHGYTPVGFRVVRRPR